MDKKEVFNSYEKTDIVLLEHAVLHTCQRSSKLQISFTCENETETVNGDRMISTRLVNGNCTRPSRKSGHWIGIGGTALLLEFHKAHFPHVAQNLFYALGVLYHQREDIANIVLHGPSQPISHRHGSGWLHELINLTGLHLINEYKLSQIKNRFEVDGTSVGNCSKNQKAFIFERLVMRTATSPIWFPTTESCQWLVSQIQVHLDISSLWAVIRQTEDRFAARLG